MKVNYLNGFNEIHVILQNMIQLTEIFVISNEYVFMYSINSLSDFFTYHCSIFKGNYEIQKKIQTNFLLIADIGDKLLSVSRLFPDDTSLGYASQDEDQITYVINHDLHELGDWSKRRLMSFNPDKAEIMLFRNVENSRNFDFLF